MIDKQQIRDYVMMMLGAPVVKIELQEEQIDFCISEAAEFIEASVHPNHTEKQKLVLLKEGSLIYAKRVLGRIRSKFSDIPSAKKTTLDGKQLLEEVFNELPHWQEEVRCDPNE